MDLTRLIIINQGTIAGVSGYPDGSNRRLECGRPDSSLSGDNNSNRLQGRLSPASDNPIFLSDRESITPVPGQSIKATQGFLLRKEEHTGQEEASSVPQLRVNSPFSETSESDDYFDAKSGWGRDQQDFTPQIPLSSSIGNEHKQQGSNTVGHSRSREALPENSGSESAYSDALAWGESDQPLLSAVGSQPVQPTLETVRKNGQEASGDVNLEALDSEPKPKKTGFFASITGMLGKVGKKNRGQEAKTHTSPKNTQEPTAGHRNLSQATKPSETSSSSPSTSHKPVKTGWTFNPIKLVKEFTEEKLKKTAFEYAEDPRFQKALANAIRNLLINEIRTIDSLAEDVMPSFSSSSVRPKERGVFNSLYGEVKCHIKTRCIEALSECIQYGSGKILGNSEGSHIGSFTPAVSFALQQKVENFLIGNLRWLVTSPEGGEKIQLWLEGKLKDFIERESRGFQLNQPAGESDSELKKQIEELSDDLTRKIDEGLRSVSTAVKNSVGGNSLPLVRFLGAAVNEILIKAVEEGTLKVESDFEGFANEVIGVLVHSIQDVHSDVVRMFSTKTAAEFRKVKDLREGLIQKVINATINEYCKAIGGRNFLRLAKKPVEWLVKSKLDALIKKYSDEDKFKKEVDELLIKNIPDVIAAIKLSIQRAKWIAARLALHEEIKAKYIDEGIEHHDEVAADDTQKLNRSQLLPTEIPAVSQGLVEAVKLGLGELQRHQPEIKAQIQPHLTAVVDTAVKCAAAHGAVQVAGAEGAAAMQPEGFSAAAMPWCQGTVTELLNQALTRGLATATAWVEQEQDGARAAITRALTPASGDSADATGQAVAAAGDDLSARVLPHLREAIDGRLDEALADILSQGVAPLRTAVQESRLLSTPAIRDGLDQVVLQVVEAQLTRAGGQVDPLSDNVIKPVMATLASELTAGQTTAVANVVAWLKNADNARALTGKITPALRQVVERVLADVLVDQLLPEGSEDGTESFKAAIQPYLHGLVEQFLDRAVNYSLERVVAWAEGHGDDITALVKPEIEKTLAGAREEVTEAIRAQQQRLSLMAKTHREQGATATRLASQVAVNTEIRHGRKATGPTAPEAVTATGATSGGEQKPAWQRLLPTEIPAVSQGLVEAVKLGLGELQRHQPEIKAQIQPHLTAVVDTAVKCAAAHGAVQVAGAEGAAAMQPEGFSAAAMPWCQGTVTELLNQALTRGLATATAWVEQEQDGARAALTRALTPASGDLADATGQAVAAAGDDLSARVLPHLREAIDGRLDEALADILSQGVAPLRTAVQESRLLSTPAIRDGLDQVVLQVVEAQLTRAGGQVDPLSDNVIKPVMATLASELTAGQTTAVASVVAWLKNADNARALTGKITPALRQVVERVLADVLVDQLLPEGSEDGTESFKAAIQPYLHGLVEQFLDRAVNYSLERVVAWAEGHGDDITALVKPEIEKTLAGAREEVTEAIRAQQQRLSLMAKTHREQGATATRLASQVAVNTEIRHGRKATGPTAPEAVTATGATSGGEQKPAWQRLLPTEIPAVSQGLVEAVKLGLGELQRHQPEIKAQIQSHLTAVVDTAVKCAAAHGAVQVAGAEGAAAMQPEGFSAAAMPWCQGTVTELLNQALTRGLATATAWVEQEQDGARAALTRALTPASGDLADATGQAVAAAGDDLSARVLPHLREAIDGRLDEALADILSQGVAPLRTAVQESRLLSTPAIRDGLDQVVLQVVEAQLTRAGGQVDPLSDNVIKPVMATLASELTAGQTTAVANVVAWLKNADNARALTGKITPALRPVVERVLADVLVDQLLPEGSEDGTESFKAAIQPYLHGLVEQFLDRAVNYSLERVVAWAEGHGDDITALVKPEIEKTLAGAREEVTEAIRAQQQRLSLMAKTHREQGATATRLASQVAVNTEIRHGRKATGPTAPEAVTATGATSGGEQKPAWQRLLPTEIPAVSQGLVEAVKLGLGELQRHQPEIKAQIQPHLTAVVDTAVKCAAAHGAVQVAGAEGAAAMQPEGFSAAAMPWCQGTVTELLNQALTRGLATATAWVEQEQDGARAAITRALTPASGDSADATGQAVAAAGDDLSARVLPHLREAIDGRLDEALADILSQGVAPLRTAVQESRLLSTPAIRDGLDQVVLQVVEAQLTRAGGQVDPLSDNVIKPVMATLASELTASQTTAVASVVAWLKNADNARALTGKITPALRQVVERVLADVLVDQLLPEGSEDGTESFKAAIQPYLHGLVEQFLDRAVNYSLERVVAWAEGHGDDITALVKPEIEKTLAGAREEVTEAIRAQQQRLSLMAKTHREQGATATRLASQVAVNTEIRHGRKATGPTAPEAVTATGATSGGEQKPAWQRLLTAEVIGSLGDGLVTALRQGVSVVRTKRQAIEDEIRPHLPPLVTTAVETGARHAGQQVTGDQTLDRAANRFREAVEPWCQGLASGLLTEALDEGLNKVKAWLDRGAARAAIIAGLTPTGGEEPGVSGLSGLILPKVLPEIQEAIDGQLNQVMARVLRQGARQFQTTMDNNRLLSLPAVRSAVEQVAQQALQKGAGKLGAQLEPLSTEVLDPVKVALKAELVTFQTTAVTNLVDWLKADDYAGVRQLMAPLVTQLKQIVQPMLLTLLAEQLGDTVERDALEQLATPYLNGLVQALLAPAIDDSLKRVIDWAEGNPQAILDEIDPTVKETVDWAQSMLMDAVRNKQLQLQSFMAEEGEVTVVERVRLLADGLAGAPEVADEPAAASTGPELLTAEAIGSLSRGITAVISNGADIIRRKAWADNLRLKLGEDEHSSRMSILPMVKRHVQRMVNEAVSAGTEYGIRQLAEPSDGDPVGVTKAIKVHVQGLTADYLSHMVADAIEGLADAVNKNAGDIQNSIEAVLKNSGPPMDLAALLTPHINGAIDQALHQGWSFIQEGISRWIEANASEATPELHKAIDKILTHIMANGGKWVKDNQQGIEIGVLAPIQEEITATLKKAQADIIKNVALWLSDEANLNRLVSTFTNEIRTAVTNVVTATVAKQISGKDRGPEFERVINDIIPYVTPIVDQALTQGITYTVKCLSGWVQHHGADISSLVNPLIDKTVQDVMPSVSDAVQKKAAVLARKEAQKIDFNKLAAELAVAFVDRFDPDTLTSGALKIEPKSSVAKELPKVLCFLMQTAETYECLGGNLMEPVKIDRVEIDGRVFKDIKAQLIKMADGSIRIRKMDLKFEDINKIDVDIEIAGISISYQLPEKSKLYRAALLSSAPMMSPADLARSLFDAFVPEHIDFNIDQITGEFHDDILDGPGEDTLCFGLSDIKLSLRLHQYYPKPYMDISVGPKDGHKTIESIKVKVAGQGVVDHIEADINVDRYRNGSADVRVQVEPGRLSRLAGWLLGGPVEIEAKSSINNAIGTLNGVESIRVRAPRFGGICNALVKNTIKAFNPDFSLGDDGNPVLKLKLALFSEERSNPITRWLAKAANRILQFFTKPIEVQLSFKGAPYVPPEKGEKGLGSFNGIRLIDGLFNPCPLSIQSDTHEELLRDLRAVSIDENPQGHLNQLGKIIDQVIEEFRLGNAPSDLSLVREIPLESLALLVNHVKANDGRQEDCARLLFLVANLVEALPEKAVQLVNSTGFTPEPGGQPYLLHLISATPTTCWLANPEDGKVMEPVYQSHRFKCLQEFWKNSQSNPDGSIYRPDSEKEPVQAFTEKAVEKVRTLVGEINIPDGIKLMMARDFDFAKMFGIGAPTKQDLVVSSPVNQPLFYSHGVPPVNHIKDIEWSKRRFDVPEGIELSGGSTAPVA